MTVQKYDPAPPGISGVMRQVYDRLVQEQLERAPMFREPIRMPDPKSHWVDTPDLRTVGEMKEFIKDLPDDATIDANGYEVESGYSIHWRDK